MAERKQKKPTYTFDDLLLLPQNSEVLPAIVDLRTRLDEEFGFEHSAFICRNGYGDNVYDCH